MNARFTLTPLPILLQQQDCLLTDTAWINQISQHAAGNEPVTKHALKKFYNIIDKSFFQQHFAAARHSKEFYAVLTTIYLLSQQYKSWHLNFIDLEMAPASVKESLSAWDFFDATRHNTQDGRPGGSENGREKIDFYLAFTQFLNSQNDEHAQVEQLTFDLDYFAAEFMRVVPRISHDYFNPATRLDAGLAEAAEQLVQLAEQTKVRVLKGVAFDSESSGPSMFAALAKNACLHECINHSNYHIKSSQTVPVALDAFIAAHFNHLLSYSCRRAGIDDIASLFNGSSRPDNLHKAVTICLMLHAIDRPAGNIFQTFRALQLPFEQNTMAAILLFHREHKIEVKRIDRGATAKAWSLWSELVRFVDRIPDCADERALFTEVEQQMILLAPELLKYLCSFFSAVTSLPDNPADRGDCLESYFKARTIKWMTHKAIYRSAINMSFKQHQVWNRALCLQLKKIVASKKRRLEAKAAEVGDV